MCGAPRSGAERLEYMHPKPSSHSGRIVGKQEVIGFIRHVARWRRFFRCSLAASNFRSWSA